MESKDIPRCADDDPKRCTQVTGKGQCHNLADNEYGLCPAHISSINRTIQAKALRMYDLTRWKANVEKFANDGEISNLRMEIGIVRMTLERVLECCQDDNTLLIHSMRIGELVKTIQKLVTDCNRLDKFAGKYLDKACVLKLGGDIIEAIASRIDDEDTVQAIAGDILKLMNEASPLDMEES